MTKFILGKKIGMTRIFNEKGKVIPVTIIEAGPVFVTQVKNLDAKTQVQVGYGQSKKNTKSIIGHLKKAKIDTPLRYFHEYSLPVTQNEILKSGQTISVDTFSPGDIVNIQGISKGKGFAGTVKRHNFTTGPKTHGSNNYRQPGSIGSAYPQRVLKGTRMAGHMGAKKVTVKKLKVITVDKDKNLLVLSGPVPGANGALLNITGV